jgi:acetylornithine deacetylase/succinyl-diaminopimelate desuccinylase-like protein
VEFRSCADEDLSALRSALEAVASAHASDGVEVRLAVVGVRPGNGEVDERALEAMTRRNAEIVSTVTGDDADICCASTDANIALSQGVRANTIGTVTGALLHTRAEWIDPTSLKAGLEVILRVMCASWSDD